MEQGIKSEVRQDMMREFGNVKNEVGRINQTLVNHCFLLESSFWPNWCQNDVILK